jgi:hypothetical protein
LWRLVDDPQGGLFVLIPKYFRRTFASFVMSMG